MVAAASAAPSSSYVHDLEQTVESYRQALAKQDRQLHALRRRQAWANKVVGNTHLSASQRLAILGLGRVLERDTQRQLTDHRPVYLAAVGKQAGLSDATVSRALRDLEPLGAVAIDTRPTVDPKTGQPRTINFIAAGPLFLKPDALQPAQPRNHGGKRPRCQECGSDNVRVRVVRRVECRACGTVDEQLVSESTPENPHEQAALQVESGDEHDEGRLGNVDDPALQIVAPSRTNDGVEGVQSAMETHAEPTLQVETADAAATPASIPAPGDRTLEQTRRIVAELQAAGLSPVPLAHALAKFPVITDWPRLPFTPTDWTLDTDGRPLGIGLRCGLQPDGTYFYAIDLDSHDPRQDAAAALAEGTDRLPAFLLGRLALTRSTGGRGRYVLLRSALEVASGDLAERNGHKAGELLAGGKQVVLPPSAHWLTPSGLPTFVLDAAETTQVLEALGATVMPPAPVRSARPPLVGSCVPERDTTPVVPGAPRTRPPALDDPQWRTRTGPNADHYWFAFLPDELAADFKARYTVDDLLDFNQRGFAFASWRGETKPSVQRLEDGLGWIDFGASGKGGKNDGGDVLALQCRIDDVTIEQLLARLGKEFTAELKRALEDAGKAGQPLPAWVARCTTPVGWAHYDALCPAVDVAQPAAMSRVFASPFHEWNAVFGAGDYARACALIRTYPDFDWTPEREQLAQQGVTL